MMILVGCGQPPSPPLGPDGNPDAVLELGRDTFASRCAVCHGADGEGGRSVALNDEVSAQLYPEIEDLLSVIADGKGSGMPAFRDALSADEQLAVARYIREVIG